MTGQWLQVEIGARENLYKGSDETGYTLTLCKRIATRGIPFIFITFKLLYWTVGLFHVYAYRSNL